MKVGRVKCLLVAAFSLFCLVSGAQQKEQGNKHLNTEDKATMDQEGKKKFDASEVIFGHVLDAHQFHCFSYKSKDGIEHYATIPLPVLLYSPQKGFSAFSSSKFHHGEEEYNGYRLITPQYKEHLAHEGYTEEELKDLRNESIIAVDEKCLPDKNIQ